MLVLDEGEVRKHLKMDALVPAMESALRALSNGDVVQPVRSTVEVARHDGFFLAMPAYAAGALGAKLVTLYPKNTQLPTHHALIMLFDPATGAPVAVMDGRLITEMRTGAASAAATNVLARKDAAVLAVLGSGAQARSHIEALRLVRQFTEVRIWSPRNAAALARDMDAQATESAEAAVRGADVIVVATMSETAVLHGEWVSPGTHINAVGAARPDWRELDDDLVLKAKLYVDSRAAAMVESGDVRAAETVHGEIGEVFAERVKGREGADEITLFKSVGVAVEDIAAASIVLENYIEARSRDT
jgi:ornithine cyclodeaminase/alanine dehydrogenase-like protein (mu-crystallin family)